jgi:hypothetical protein
MLISDAKYVSALRLCLAYTNLYLKYVFGQQSNYYGLFLTTQISVTTSSAMIILFALDEVGIMSE